MTSQANFEEIPVTIGSGNVFGDLDFPNPEEEQLKARLAYQIMLTIERLRLSQARAAKLLGVSQPNVSNLARGHYEDFSIDRLLRFLKALGTDVEVVLKPGETVAFGRQKHREETQELGADFLVEETRAVAFHEQTCAESVSIWREGLNVWLRGFDPVHGYVVGNETEPMMIALLMRAWQTTYRAFDNTLKGYYPQALNLLRSPIEDWLAYWYLRSFPEEYERFAGIARDAPTFNDMLQKVEAKHFQGQPNPIIRDWIKRLHEYSHVERAGLQMVVLSSNTGVKLLIGPDQDAGAFEYCSADAVALIVPHLEALSNLRKSFGLPEVSEFDSFRRRVDAHHSVLAHQ